MGWERIRAAQFSNHPYTIIYTGNIPHSINVVLAQELWPGLTSITQYLITCSYKKREELNLFVEI